MGAIALIGLGMIFLIALAGAGKQSSEASEIKEGDDLDRDIEEAIKEIEKEKKESFFDIDKIKSPFSSRKEGARVEDDEWKKYVKVSIVAKPNTISKGYNLGMFLINMRTLEDFGYTKNVKKQKDGTWRGNWVAPFSLEKFLGNPNFQYEVFEKVSINHYNAILNRHKNDLGREVEGEPLNLSGAMGVAKHAGLGGLAKWIKESPDKRKSNTTKAYKRANGIF